MFNVHCSDPCMQTISSEETIPPIYIALTLSYNGCIALIWFIETLFSVMLTFLGESSDNISLYPARVCSWTNCRKDHWSSQWITDHIIMMAKKATVTLPVALSKALWNYWAVQKGKTNHYNLLVLPMRKGTHTMKYERAQHCALCEFLNVSDNEKWLKGCCSGIWQVFRNKAEGFQRRTLAVIQACKMFGPSIAKKGSEQDGEGDDYSI